VFFGIGAAIGNYNKKDRYDVLGLSYYAGCQDIMNQLNIGKYAQVCIDNANNYVKEIKDITNESKGGR
jgi:hypothetical protein